ncbi:MAG: hypothetical protein Hals2KO_18130 [Halioglobus sp.]
MKATITHIDPAAEYFFVEGCHINELSNTADDPDVSIARARVEPGNTTRWHLLDGITERYVLLQGEGRVEVEGLAPSQVAAGDVVTIAAGLCQRITNTGSSDLVFLAICSPRFVQSAYRDMDDSPPC